MSKDCQVAAVVNSIPLGKRNKPYSFPDHSGRKNRSAAKFYLPPKDCMAIQDLLPILLPTCAWHPTLVSQVLCSIV